MTYLARYLFLQLICHDPIFDHAMCYNLEPSLTIIMDDGDEYFEENNVYVQKSS